ncbi:MAG: Ppx/GppA family phosphatase [Deltaproteobacteria bacterium]|nr:Ppx/GppA family phosphatase [Deltaproteobacteria bacterium]
MLKKYASIDIGTNTLRLLIAEVDNKKLKPIFLKRMITRLGGGYREEVGITKEAKERTIKALEVFSEKIREYDVKEVKAVATSVVRRAKNKQDFLKDVLERTGIEVKAILGDEEARLSLLGVLSVIKAGTDLKSVPKCLVVDIGGGSTEFIAADGGRIAGAWSLEMGVVHLTENYLKTDPPTKRELNAMEDEIERIIYDLRFTIYDLGFLNPKSEIRNPESEVFIGTAGTITTLAAIDQGLEKYEPEKINNFMLTYNAVQRIYQHLASLPLKQREEILSLEKGREDIIIPGAAILLKAMECFGFNKMAVSDAGLLEGILLDSCKLQVASCR